MKIESRDISIITYAENLVITIFNQSIYPAIGNSDVYVHYNIDGVKIKGILYSAMQVAALVQESFVKMGYDTDTNTVNNDLVILTISWLDKNEIPQTNEYKIEFENIPAKNYKWLTSGGTIYNKDGSTLELKFNDFKHDTTSDYVYIMQNADETNITTESTLNFEKYIGYSDILVNYKYQYIDYNNPEAGNRFITSKYIIEDGKNVEYLENGQSVQEYNQEILDQYYRKILYARLSPEEYSEYNKRFTNAQLKPYSYIFTLTDIEPYELINGRFNSL